MKKSDTIHLVGVGITSGVAFAVMDGIINTSPFVEDLFLIYEPIARASINIPAGIAIDIFYGLFMAALFFILYPSLPGSGGFQKGLSYGTLTWFFRVLMSTLSSWMVLIIPLSTLLYTLVTGFIEMLILGIFYGMTLRR